MFFNSAKPMCHACFSLFRWLAGLTLLALGVIGLLGQLGVFAESPWGFVWPIVVLIWGLVILFNVGCKECGK